MKDWTTVVALTLMAGMSMPLGALVATRELFQADWLRQEFRHTVIAFGGGALMSAVALVLVPEGARGLSLPWVVVCFTGGGLAFMALDALLAWLNTPASQLAAMLSDFIPEALALGAACALGSPTGPLLAGLIALQNLPEGFNAYRELTALSGRGGWRVVAAFFAMAFLGPAAGLTGYFWLASYPALVSGIMLFAAGGILYLTFQDIAPQVKLDCHWAPPLGAVAGFLLGIVGEMLVENGAGV